MTYLELCAEAARECRVPGTGPTTTAEQTGKLGRIVAWVASEYTEIQNRHKWRWLRKTFTFNTVADDDSYAYTDVTDVDTGVAIARFSEWRLNDRNNPPKIYLTASGTGVQTWLTYISWDAFNAIYKIGSQTSSQPVHITVDPDNNIVLGPAPNDVYTVTGDFYRSAQTLSSDSDVPEMPSQFHRLIVYNTMQEYGSFDVSPEVLTRGEVKSRKLMRQLEANQLPRFRKGCPVA